MLWGRQGQVEFGSQSQHGRKMSKNHCVKSVEVQFYHKCKIYHLFKYLHFVISTWELRMFVFTLCLRIIMYYYFIIIIVM